MAVSDASQPTPDEALKRFAELLPDTINTAVLVQCISPFGRFELNPCQDYFATFCEIIDDADLRHRAAQCAKVIGVMELALENDAGAGEFYGEIAKATGLVELEKIALRLRCVIGTLKPRAQNFIECGQLS